MARTENLIQYSGRLDHPVWIKSQADVTSAGDSSSPTLRRNSYVTQSLSSSGSISQNIPKELRQNGTRYRAGVFFKDVSFGTYNFKIIMGCWGTDNATIQHLFNPATQTRVNQLSGPSAGGRSWGSVTSSIEKLANGWALAWIEGVIPTDPTGNNYLRIAVLPSETTYASGRQILIGGVSVARGDTISNYYLESSNAPRYGQVYDTFDFPFHTFSTTYPDNGTRVQMGKSYIFSARPAGPPQRVFKLRFRGMRWYESNGVRDSTTDAQSNLCKMEDFYKLVETWASFIWVHPLEGPKVVKFNRPIEIPEQIEGGFGLVNPFDVELIEQP